MKVITRDELLELPEAERCKVMIRIINGEVRYVPNKEVNPVTTETRKSSYIDSQKNAPKRYAQIKEILKGREMTAKEIAVELFKRGYTDSDDRNYSQPRLTALVSMKEVSIVGKKICQYTNKNVAVYKLNEE